MGFLMEEGEECRFCQEEDEIPEHLISECSSVRSQCKEDQSYEFLLDGDISLLKPYLLLEFKLWNWMESCIHLQRMGGGHNISISRSALDTSKSI